MYKNLKEFSQNGENFCKQVTSILQQRYTMCVCHKQFFLFSCRQWYDWRSDDKLSYFPEHSVIFWYLRDWFEKWFFSIAHLSLGYHKNQETAGSNSPWESSVKSLLIPQAEFITFSWGVPLCLMYTPLLYFSHWWQLLVDISVSPTRQGAGCVLLTSVCWAF